MSKRNGESDSVLSGVGSTDSVLPGVGSTDSVLSGVGSNEAVFCCVSVWHKTGVIMVQ